MRSRFTRQTQCERCGELDDGACACTQAVVLPPACFNRPSRATLSGVVRLPTERFERATTVRPHRGR